MRHHQVKHDEINCLVSHDLAHLPPVPGCRDRELVLFEILHQQLTQIAVIVDNQDVVLAIHGCPNLGAPARAVPG